ncbi:hypothetical protein GCM10010246_04260 [Streptomyces cuspidosporus]|uniref:Uncharacterized protein n=1 Tax=Streptomyces cuspidosporus TaxID=66882 RepID=A0ABN3FBM9_9ACTN
MGFKASFPTDSEASELVEQGELTGHARQAALVPHLRTCWCGEDGCRWHPRHPGCDGPLLLLLTCGLQGRVWRLADTCRACAALTPDSAAVPEPRHAPPADRARSSGFLPEDDESCEVFDGHLWWTDEPHRPPR